MASATSELRHPKGPAEVPVEGAGPFFWALFDSTVGAKILVAFTGIGLVIFTLFHMLGNLKLFAGREAIDDYAHFLKHDLGVLIWIARALLLIIFILHIVLAVRLKFRSWAARSIPYQYPRSAQASIASRTMVWSGIVVGLFIIFHLAQFTFCWVTGVEIAPGQVVNYVDLKDKNGYQDVYSMVVAAFRMPILAFIYIVAQIALYLHLSHGVQSSFQTLGLKNRRFTRFIRVFGFAVAVTILIGNVAIVLAVLTGVVPQLPPVMTQAAQK